MPWMRTHSLIRVQDYRLNCTFEEIDHIVQTIYILHPVPSLLRCTVGQDLLCEHIEVESDFKDSVPIVEHCHV